jgi:fibronectin-binding autotransporter adhesin
MSEVINPPDYYFPGINFNPAFYSQDTGSGISQAEANALYLRKTVPDTATAQETFNAGIITPTISSTGTMSITSGSGLTIGPPDNTTMNIGINSSVDINVGTGSRNSSPATIHHYSDGDDIPAGNNVYLNNGERNKSSTLIQCGDGTTSNRSDGNVEIKTGVFNTGEIRIGQFTSGSNKTTTVIKGDVNLNSDTGGTITIGNATAGSTTIQSDTITIGNGGSTTTMNGTVQANTIEGTANGSNMTYGGNLRGGSIAIGTGLTNGGTVAIGSANSTTTMNGTVKANTINGTEVNSAMTIGSNLNSSGTITIGSSASATTMNGTAVTVPTTAGGVGGHAVNVTYLGTVISGLQSIYARLAIDNTFTLTNTFNNATMGIRASKISALTNTGVLEIGSDLTQPTGKVVIGSTNSITEIGCTARSTTITGSTMGINGITTITGATTVLGTTNINITGSADTTIGNSTGTLTVNGGGIKTNKIESTAALKINETSNVETAINSNTSAAQNLTIGTAAYTTQYLRGTTININEFGSGNTVIGTSGGTGAITLNRPLTPGYLPSAITSTQIGYTVEDTINLATLTSATANNAFTTAVILPAGVWNISWCIRMSSIGSTVTVQNYYAVDGTNLTALCYAQTASETSVVGTVFGTTGNFVLASGGTTTYQVVLFVTYSGATLTLLNTGNYRSLIRRTRIA